MLNFDQFLNTPRTLDFLIHILSIRYSSAVFLCDILILKNLFTQGLPRKDSLRLGSNEKLHLIVSYCPLAQRRHSLLLNGSVSLVLLQS